MNILIGDTPLGSHQRDQLLDRLSMSRSSLRSSRLRMQLLGEYEKVTIIKLVVA